MAGMLAVLCALAALAKLHDLLVDWRDPGLPWFGGLLCECVAFTLVLRGRLSLAAWLMIGFALLSCAAHLAGLVPARCNCLGGLSRLHHKMALGYAATQGLLAVGLLAAASSRPARLRKR